MRDPIELSIIERELENSKIVAVTAYGLIRYLRTKKAGLTSGPCHFIKLGKKPTERYINELIKDADYIIKNNGKRYDLYLGIDDLVMSMNLNK